MLACIRAEYLKLNRTFTKKMFWMAPLLNLLLCFGLMGGRFFQTASCNWWYFLLLPGALSLICGGIIQKDMKKLNNRAFLGLPVDPGQIWLGKIGAAAILLALASAVLFIGVTIGGVLLPAQLTLASSAAATLLIPVTFLWQIPFCLLLANRFGLFGALLVNLSVHVVCSAELSVSNFWWIFPHAIPARLMCAVIGVLPNGLAVPAGDALLDTGVILPGVAVSLAWFAALSLLGVPVFRKLEAK